MVALFVVAIAVLGVTDTPLPAGGRFAGLVEMVDDSALRDRFRDLVDTAERFLPRRET